ncbi:acyltransferase family protein [Streptomyces sp. NPDC003006]
MGSNLQKRLPSLTGMRFIAALLVFLAHISIENLWDEPEVNDSLTHTVNRLGWVGVGFFFILSGFVLTWSARPQDTTRSAPSGADG